MSSSVEQETVNNGLLEEVPSEFVAAAVLGIPLCNQVEMVNAAEMTARAIKFGIKDGFMRKTVRMPRGADIIGVTLSPVFGGVPDEAIYQLSLMVNGGDYADIIDAVFEIRGLRSADYSEASRKAVWQPNATLKGGTLSVYGGFLTVALVEE